MAIGKQFVKFNLPVIGKLTFGNGGKMTKKLTLAIIFCWVFGVLSLLLQPASLRGQGLGLKVRIKGGVEFNRNEETTGVKPCNPPFTGGGIEVQGLVPGFNLEAGIGYSSKSYLGYTFGEHLEKYRTKIDYDHLSTGLTIRTNRFLAFGPIESYWGFRGAVHYLWISHKLLDNASFIPPTSWKRHYHRFAIEGLVGLNFDIPNFPLGFFLEGCFSHLFAKEDEFKNFPYLYSGITLKLR